MAHGVVLRPAPAVEHKVDKGLADGRLGFWPLIVIGMSSTAPLYSLAATLGYIVIAAGAQAPIALIVAFIPMALTAMAYKELTTAVPDAGTAFTWASKTFGPRTGWFTGWSVLVSSVIVMAAQSEVASRYFLYMIGDGSLGSNQVVVTSVGVAMIAAMTFISYRRVEAGALTQYALLGMQYAAIIAFCLGLWKLIDSGNYALKFNWQWFNPFATDNPTGFLQAVLFAIFIYWGWDSCMSLSEESKDPVRGPGFASLMTTCMLLITYVGMTILTMMYAGIGGEGVGLSNQEFADDVFYNLRGDALGEWGWLLVFAVFISALATCQTTILPAARGIFAMGVYKALPPQFASVNKYQTPGYATLFVGTVSAAFYVGMTIISQDVLADTIEATSLAVAVYYTITSFACIAYFRKSLFDTPRNALNRFILPAIGGVLMGGVFITSAIHMFQPDYGYTTILGTSGTFVMGVGSLAMGLVVVEVAARLRSTRPFFAGQSLNRGTAVKVPEESPI